ncbi:MAG: Fic family protein [Candidatus Contendobacter sp.]|nr:Fic family protein [Candidatus Contendobacter sp.]MDG4559167.1 Fic family protein [Candidatus Contendobacter sp.]
MDPNVWRTLDRRVETARFGPFTFQIGVDPHEVALALPRVEDAHQRFIASPLSQVANQLEREVVASSVFGTNTIEGGMLTEEETAATLALAPEAVQEIEQRRVVNIKAAYDCALQAASVSGWRLDLDFIREIHAAITRNLPHPRNEPGAFRDNPKTTVTHVGDTTHGGCYKPPQYGGDIHLLMRHFVEWHENLVAAEVPALIRAPLVHLYYELIHPFWDGNGRVGRVLEATVLQAVGYRYAPFAMARYYLENLDAYFALFNACRKRADKREEYPNTPFVAFHLEGMRVVINRLHDRVNLIVYVLLFQSRIRKLLDVRKINTRQYTILAQLLTLPPPVSLERLRQSPWYQALYLQRGDKTRQRDLRQLRERGLIHIKADQVLLNLDTAF